MMRRLIALLFLAMCFCLTAACGAEDVLSQMTGGQSAVDSSDTNTDTDTDADAPAQPEQSAGELPPLASATDTQPQTDAQRPQSGFSAEGLTEGSMDFSALSADECVADAISESGVLPRITLDCPGAETINQAIQSEFFSVAEDPLWDLHYEYAKGAGRVLSLVMVKQANDWSERTVYNLDLATGQTLTGAELLALLDVDTNELANLEQAILGEEYTHQFGAMESQTDQEFYDQQYALTTSPDNVELEKLWFSSDGQLCFAGRIYGLAGAEYYEYQLSTGWTF